VESPSTSPSTTPEPPPERPRPVRGFARFVAPVAIALILVAVLAFVKMKQIDVLIRAGKAAQTAGPPPEMVSTAPAKKETWEAVLPSVGSIETAKGVTLSNDAPGVVSAIKFESGQRVKKGDVLVQLDANVEGAQLASAKARKHLAESTLTRNKALVAAGTLAGSTLDSDEAALKTADADIAQLEAQIARKIVRAPFAGTLGIRNVNLGQYLNPGTPLTVLQADEAQFIDFTLPQEHLGEVSVGMPVRITIDGPTPTTIDGTIAAIDPTIDPVTRSIKLRSTASKGGDQLRPGMFVNVAVVLPQKRDVVSVPATAVVHAAYGDSVFIVEDKPGAEGQNVKVARQQFVRAGESRGDFVAIEEGVQADQQIVVAGAFKLRNGSAVTVNNTDVQLSPKLNPTPENH
jgi:membrane fusion protein (multidrug efflux system)